MKDGTVDGGIKSLEKSLRILEVLGESQRELGLTEIAESLGQKISTVYNLLATLRSCGFVEQDRETKRYRLGLKVFSLGHAAHRKMDLPKLALPVMEELAAQFGETVTLAILSGDRVVYVGQVLSSRSVKMTVSVGDHAPLFCTASGKVFLADLSEMDRRRFLEGSPLKGYTGKTIANPNLLLEELEAVRNRGYALDDEEREEGLRCIAVPVRDHQGKVLASISISGPSNRLSLERLTDLAPVVMEKAEAISERLGFNPKGVGLGS